MKGRLYRFAASVSHWLLYSGSWLVCRSFTLQKNIFHYSLISSKLQRAVKDWGGWHQSCCPANGQPGLTRSEVNYSHICVSVCVCHNEWTLLGAPICWIPISSIILPFLSREGVMMKEKDLSIVFKIQFCTSGLEMNPDRPPMFNAGIWHGWRCVALAWGTTLPPYNHTSQDM